VPKGERGIERDGNAPGSIRVTSCEPPGKKAGESFIPGTAVTSRRVLCGDLPFIFCKGVKRTMALSNVTGRKGDAAQARQIPLKSLALVYEPTYSLGPAVYFADFIRATHEIQDGNAKILSRLKGTSIYKDRLLVTATTEVVSRERF